MLKVRPCRSTIGDRSTAIGREEAASARGRELGRHGALARPRGERERDLPAYAGAEPDAALAAWGWSRACAARPARAGGAATSEAGAASAVGSAAR